jgi:hypothetical protein
MPKLRFKIYEQEFEAEGTEEEILSLYDRLCTHIDELKIAESNSVNLATLDAEARAHAALSLSMPTVEQLVSFILSKPKYEHDIVEIEDHFLKKRITSRDNPSLYRKLSFDLQKARKVIETQKAGEFVQHATPSKNLKKYMFKPLSRSLTEVYEKPS